MLKSAHFSKGCNCPPPRPLPTSLCYNKIFCAYTDLYFPIMHAISFLRICAIFFCDANVS